MQREQPDVLRLRLRLPSRNQRGAVREPRECGPVPRERVEATTDWISAVGNLTHLNGAAAWLIAKECHERAIWRWHRDLVGCVARENVVCVDWVNLSTFTSGADVHNVEVAVAIVCGNESIPVRHPTPTSRPAISTSHNALAAIVTRATDRELHKVAVLFIAGGLPDHLIPTRVPVVGDHINATRSDRLR